ncbi:MAG: phosphoesterase [candidate division WOR-3 bacterium]|nr:phosphoesterase [candidate division WOR-3 bacterium]
MKASHERVLCFPKSLLDELGGFQGFRPDDGTLLERILSSGQARFIERGRAEEDPSFKQLIPYVVMVCRERLLCYVRGKETGEGRLCSLGSVGIGGHISVTDHSLFERSIREIFAAGLRREVTEEVEVQTEFTERVAGLINDDSNPVGRVHLGVLVLWELEEPRVVKRERSITSLEFLSIQELRKGIEDLETWSQIVIANWLDIV